MTRPKRPYTLICEVTAAGETDTFARTLHGTDPDDVVGQANELMAAMLSDRGDPFGSFRVRKIYPGTNETMAGGVA